MNKFVNAEDVKDLLNGLDSLPWENEVEDMVDSLIVADVVEVKHGKWVSIPLNGANKFRCSNIDCCRLIPLECDPSELKYCPYCGTKMDGE